MEILKAKLAEALHPTRTQLMKEDRLRLEALGAGLETQEEAKATASASGGGSRGVHHAVAGTAEFPVIEALKLAMSGKGDPAVISSFLNASIGSGPGFRSDVGLGKIARAVGQTLAGKSTANRSGLRGGMESGREQLRAAAAPRRTTGAGFGPGPGVRPTAPQSRPQNRQQRGQERDFQRKQRAADIRSELEIKNQFRNQFAKEIIGMLQGLTGGNRTSTQQTEQVVNNAGRWEKIPINTRSTEPIDFVRLIQGLI